jgi:TIR domain
MTGPSQGGIFISYRRQDAAGWADWLHKRLAERFPGQVFMDVDAVGRGVSFADAITEAVSTCQVLLVVIGPEWLTATDDESHRKLDDPGDFIRLEIEAAFQSEVVPDFVELEVAVPA